MLQNVLFSTVAFRMKRSHFKTEDIENNRFFSDVYRSNISITNIVPQRRKSALTLVCLVAPISWRKNSLDLHQDLRPLTQVLASYYHFNLSTPPPTHTQKKSGQRNLWRDWQQLIRRTIQINNIFLFSDSGSVHKVCSPMSPFSC